MDVMYLSAELSEIQNQIKLSSKTPFFIQTTIYQQQWTMSGHQKDPVDLKAH